jgi:hypothetical protein
MLAHPSRDRSKRRSRPTSTQPASMLTARWHLVADDTSLQMKGRQNEALLREQKVPLGDQVSPWTSVENSQSGYPTGRAKAVTLCRDLGTKDLAQDRSKDLAKDLGRCGLYALANPIAPGPEPMSPKPMSLRSNVTIKRNPCVRNGPRVLERSLQAGQLGNWSGRRDSNPRPRPWQGRALPLSYTRIRELARA